MVVELLKSSTTETEDQRLDEFPVRLRPKNRGQKSVRLASGGCLISPGFLGSLHFPASLGFLDTHHGIHPALGTADRI